MEQDQKRAAQDPIRPTDADARALARDLVRSARHGALATLAGDGHPFASLTSLATDSDGTPLILISALSGHTGNLKADPRASLMVARSGKGDPLAHPRISLKVRAQPVARHGEDGIRIRRRFLARQPKARLYVDFPDFAFFALAIEGASLNGGFGRAYELAPADILCDLSGAQALVEAEEAAVAHMNDDHADAVRLYATALLGAPDGAWQVTGLDPHGLDLALADQVLRLPFPEPVVDPGTLRATLVRLAGEARAVA